MSKPELPGLRYHDFHIGRGGFQVELELREALAGAIERQQAKHRDAQSKRGRNQRLADAPETAATASSLPPTASNDRMIPVTVPISPRSGARVMHVSMMTMKRRRDESDPAATWSAPVRDPLTWLSPR